MSEPVSSEPVYYDKDGRPYTVRGNGTSEWLPEQVYQDPYGRQYVVRGGVSTWLTPAQPAAGRNRIAAALFALFLGGLGVHKFYLGQIGLGILYLVFCWTFIPAIVGLVEGIILLTMSDAEFAAKYP